MWFPQQHNWNDKVYMLCKKVNVIYTCTYILPNNIETCETGINIMHLEQVNCRMSGMRDTSKLFISRTTEVVSVKY